MSDNILYNEDAMTILEFYFRLCHEMVPSYAREITCKIFHVEWEDVLSGAKQALKDAETGA